MKNRRDTITITAELVSSLGVTGGLVSCLAALVWAAIFGGVGVLIPLAVAVVCLLVAGLGVLGGDR